MISRRTSAWMALGLCGIAALSTGCEKKKPPPPPLPPPVQPEPPPPEPVDVEALLQAMGASGVIQFPNHLAPTSEELARAIIAFCDAFARGDDGAIATMLDDSGQISLDALLEDGAWEQATGRIEAIRIVQLVEVGDFGTFRFAVQEPGKAYLLGWSAARFGSDFIFSAQESPGVTLARATDFDAFVDPAAAVPETPEEGGGTPPPGGTPPAPAPSGDPGRGNTPGIG